MFLKPSIAIALAIAAAMLAASSPASARDTLKGPYAAAIERVVDGDTIAVRVTIWLNQELTVLVRIRGIDAPEMRSRCAEERDLADRARARLALMTGDGPVVLTNITGEKYWGRVLADIATAEGGDVAAAMLAAGLARPYSGGTRLSWCEAEVAADATD